ncbi:MAG: cobalamin-dependent protein [Polyangiaceae bacterium]
MSGSTRVALLACSSPGEPAGRWLNYAARRLMAELTEPALPGVEARLFEMDPERPDEATEAVAEFAPDLLGCSAYLWSFAPLLEAAAEVERRHPDTTVVFGGPSARAAMFELEPHRGAASCVDALVVGEGERTFRAMAASKSRDLASFATLPGVAVRTPNGFSEPRFAGVADVDSLVSPYRAG